MEDSKQIDDLYNKIYELQFDLQDTKNKLKESNDKIERLEVILSDIPIDIHLYINDYFKCVPLEDFCKLIYDKIAANYSGKLDDYNTLLMLYDNDYIKVLKNIIKHL